MISWWTSGEHRARLRGDEIRLTPTEFRLLAYLVEHAGQLVTHRQVLGAVWGAGYDVDVHLLRMTIRNLRLKLDAAAPGEAYIATEYGLGYRPTGPARPVEGTGPPSWVPRPNASNAGFLRGAGRDPVPGRLALT